MSEDSKKPSMRTIPTSGLDFEMLTTNPAWGVEVTDELHQKLKDLIGEEDDGTITEEHLWGLLSFYTRDIRLGNLNFEQLEYCRYYLDMAGDCLKIQAVHSFLVSLRRAITVLELSQSKAGFLRKMVNTLTYKNVSDSEVEPRKNKLFGGKKK